MLLSGLKQEYRRSVTSTQKRIGGKSTLEISQSSGSSVTFRKLPTLHKKKPTNIDSYSFGQSLNAPFNILRPRKGEFPHSRIIYDRARSFREIAAHLFLFRCLR